MTRFLLRRFGHAFLMLFGVSVLLFVLQQAAPGEFVTEMRLNPQISAETLNALCTQYGLNQPLPTRYLRWLNSVAHGELGYSFSYNMPAAQLLWPRARNTLILAVPALLISWLIAIPLGVLAANTRSGWTNRLFGSTTSFLLAVPDVLLALLALMLALRTGWFPVGGMHSNDAFSPSLWGSFADTAWHMALPVAVLVIATVSPLVRQIRSAVLEVLDSSFIRSAEGNGLGKLTLLFRHALPAAANPLVSLFGLSVALLLSMSFLTEVVMSWPGLGPLLLEATLARDLFVVLGAVMLSTVFLMIGNLLADVLLYTLDPRIRMQG